MELVGSKEFLTLTGLSFLHVGVSVYIKTQALVYIWGRMLGAFEKGKDQKWINRSRNIIALLSTIFFTLGYQYSLITDNQVFLFIWEFLDLFSKAILIYVLIGFDLFSIVNSLKAIKLSKIKK